MRRRSRLVACGSSVALSLLLAASACGGGASDTGKQSPLKVGVGNPIFSYMPVYVAAAKGFWADEGLSVEVVTFHSGSEAQQALLGDAITIGAGSMSEPINLNSQDVPTVVFGFIEDALPYRFMSAPDITSVDQLAGKTVGVSRVGSLSDLITRITLKQVGFDPSKVTYQQAGSSPSRLAALQSGAVDAALLDSPTYQLAQDAGFNTLINVAEQLQGYPYEVLYAKKESIDANRDVFLRFMRGYVTAAQYATDPANRDEVIQIVSEQTGQKVEDLEIAYDETIKDFPPTGEPKKEGIAKMLAGTKEFGDVEGIENVTADDLFYPDIWAEVTGS